MRETILKRCTIIPVNNLIHYIEQGIVSLQELQEAGLSIVKVNQIQEAFAQSEETDYQNALNGTVEDCKSFLAKYPSSIHRPEVMQQQNLLDDIEWGKVQDNLCEVTLRNYETSFPEGKYIQECRSLLSDMPWLEAKRMNTIDGYKQYIAANPGRHYDEAKELINAILDDNDFENVKLNNTVEAFQNYLAQHPRGKHVAEAQQFIMARAQSQDIINNLYNDPCAYSAQEIQNFVANHVITWDDINSIFGSEKTIAIQNYSSQAQLRPEVPNEQLQGDTTEVYFWGIKDSGKTCALGSILSNAHSKGVLEGLDCTAAYYMNTLCNIFDTNGICTFPPGTPPYSIAEMVMNLRDQKGKKHKVTMIDLAGGVFTAVFQRAQRLNITEEQQIALDSTVRYLRDNRNNKVHFFIVDCGIQDRVDEMGLRMTNYLEYMISFLKSNKILSKKTVGVYVIVTKSDKLNCSLDERPKYAHQFVTEKLSAFWNSLKDACKENGISEPKTIAFSVGDVFAKNLCVPNNDDTDKIINILIDKTRGKGGWLGNMADSLRS